jgi:hypothetical protein
VAQKQITQGRKLAPKKEKHKMAYPDVSYNIEGAGDPSYDLTFVYQGLDVNGNPVWSGGTGSGQRWMGYDPDTEMWGLDSTDESSTGQWGAESDYGVGAGEGVTLATGPASDAWLVGNGASPAPVITLATGTGSISGTVFLSTGGDLSGVAVTVTGAGTGSATTADDGTYTVDGLPAGDFIVHFERSGYAFSPQDIPVTLSP